MENEEYKSREMETGNKLVNEQSQKCTDPNIALLESIRKGDHANIKCLLQRGVDANGKDETGLTPLKAAVLRGNSDIVQTLLEYKANINQTDDTGQTDFMRVLQAGLVPYEVIIQLLDEVEDIKEIHPDTGESFLHFVGHRGHDEFIVPLINALIDRGIPVNVRDNTGDTPLHNIAAVGHRAAMKAFIVRGADFTKQNNARQTPLHILATFAEFDDFMEGYQYHMKAKINVHATDNRGRTAMDVARERCQNSQVWHEC